MADKITPPLSVEEIQWVRKTRELEARISWGARLIRHVLLLVTGILITWAAVGDAIWRLFIRGAGNP